MNGKNLTFNAETFVKRLLEEGSKHPCDDTVESFQHQETLPPFYNEETYNRGRQFYHRNIFALFFSKLFGLLTVLAIPDILDILQLTNMSSSPKSAYRRYLSTLFHMCVWYDEDFKPGSKLWRSISEVKGRHNSASRKGCAAGLSRINQKDMALTQFGFMGYAVARSRLVGIHSASEEDWHSFIHIWRVVGYLMGIEDRFNICRESVEETRDICNVLIEKLFKPIVEKKDPEFVRMGTYLVEGMWAMNPNLEINVYLSYLYLLLFSPTPNNNNNNNNNNSRSSKSGDKAFIQLGFFGTIHLYIVIFTIYTLKFTIFRLYHNYIQYMTLWLMHVCPFLGYYKFGYADSHVNIFPNESVKKK